MTFPPVKNYKIIIDSFAISIYSISTFTTKQQEKPMGKIKQQAIETAESLRRLADMLDSSYGDAENPEPESPEPESPEQESPEQESPEQEIKPASEPMAEVQHQPTFDEIKSAVIEAAQVNRNATIAVLQNFDVKKATELHEVQYAGVFQRLKEIVQS